MVRIACSPWGVNTGTATPSTVQQVQGVPRVPLMEHDLALGEATPAAGAQQLLSLHGRQARQDAQSVMRADTSEKAISPMAVESSGARLCVARLQNQAIQLQLA